MWVQDATTAGESATTIVKKDKMNYCMHKNDIVVGVRQGWFPGSHMPNKAYPAVVTTTANMCLAAQYWLMRLYNNSKNMRDVRMMVNERLQHRGDMHNSGNNVNELETYENTQIESMPQFYFMGVSLGLAYAHPDSGDTVGTVMYGGLRTVMNGPCKANTGQPVMWIFSFEARLFNAKGQRIYAGQKLPSVIEDGMAMLRSIPDAMSSLSGSTLDRKRWHDRENANIPGVNQGKQSIIMLIPYVRPDDYAENILDRERICGTYISSAREFEMVDIKLQRQAI